MEPYRTTPRNGLNADLVFPGQKDRVAWCYRNRSKEAKPLVNLTFGAVIKGPGLTGAGDNQTLHSAAGKTQRVDVYVLTAQAETPEAWCNSTVSSKASMRRPLRLLVAVFAALMLTCHPRRRCDAH